MRANAKRHMNELTGDIVVAEALCLIESLI